MDKLIGLGTVAELTGLSREQINDLIAKGKFPLKARQSGGWRQSEIDTWAEQQQSASTTQQVPSPPAEPEGDGT